MSGRKKLDLKIHSNAYFEKCISTVESWLESKDYDLLYETGAADGIYYSVKQIVINSRNHAEKRLYVLLHECGHLLINSTKRDRVFALSRSTEAIMGNTTTRKRRVAVISEEIEAWKRGERLAKRLGIEINEEKFDKIRADAIISYVEWARD
tara:strand:- start:335 stop:790 length:456 start_codon:yes stop_codon:yes gene_type:complete